MRTVAVDGLGALVDATTFAALAVGSLGDEVNLEQATPCGEWNIGMLLEHLGDSVAAIEEGFCIGKVGLAAVPLVDPRPSTLALRIERLHLIARHPDNVGRETVPIEGAAIVRDHLSAVGALEIAVHAWDVTTAKVQAPDIPPPLATALMTTAIAVVARDDRGIRFGPPVPMSRESRVSDRLLAFLGRQP
ncbi:hypothetical protein GCM10009789_87610 [Kribbella sancticallisti]|uniref:TIGR03086 family protein n=1 Tax=Kribbella sancticallisti TaxID=460087 RepID=A0ABP4QUH7_9ACTN